MKVYNPIYKSEIQKQLFKNYFSTDGFMTL